MIDFYPEGKINLYKYGTIFEYLKYRGADAYATRNGCSEFIEHT
jgi:hypothetical protein